MIRDRNLFRQEYKHAGGWWEDFRFPASAFRLDSAATRYSFDFANLGVEFDDNARFPEEILTGIAQLPHAYLLGSEIEVHLHWAQNQDEIPNWLLEYRSYDNGEDPTGGFTQTIPISSKFTYTAGTIAQYTDMVDFNPNLSEVSGFVELKLYRDTANTSTIFAGADPYTGGALLKEMDIHYRIDQPGSYGETAKWGA